MITFTSRSTILITVITAALLSACSAPASRVEMVPQTLSTSKQHPYSIAVKSAGGSETGALDTSNIANEDLKSAIEEAITQNKLFKSVVKGSGSDYELTVNIISLSKPSFGATFTVDIETTWTLIKQSDKKVVLRKAFQSSGQATMGDALIAVARLQMAVEKAAKANISQGLNAIGELNLR